VSINTTVYGLGGSQTLSEKKGSQRQVQDLPPISVAEPLIDESSMSLPV
jgi:hypothetical protein